METQNDEVQKLLEQIITRISEMNGKETDWEVQAITGEVLGSLTSICTMQAKEIKEIQKYISEIHTGVYEGEDSVLGRVERIEHKVYGEQ